MDIRSPLTRSTPAGSPAATPAPASAGPSNEVVAPVGVDAASRPPAPAADGFSPAANSATPRNLAAPVLAAPPPVSVAGPTAVPGPTYSVQKGDSLGGISKKFETDVNTIATANKIANPNLIQVGQKLVIPDRVVVTLQAGDTLNALATRFGTTAKDLAAKNGIADPTKVAVGQQLYLPGARLYTVKAGDTLGTIAKAHGSTVADIARASQISDPNKISVGQQLVVVHASVTPGPTPNPNAGEPAVMDEHKGQVTYKPVKEPFQVGGMGADDIVQGQAGDCYLLASMSSLAQQHPEIIKNMVQANADGTYTVTFHEQAENDKAVKVTVDAKMPTDEYGSVEYGNGRDARELWPAVIEKAYAKWKGGYEAIGHGGWPADAMEQITGKFSDSGFVDGNEAKLFTKLQTQLAGKHAVVASTYGDDSGRLKGTNMVGNHAYSVLAVSEEKGHKLVTLRNPWGMQEQGNDGKDDGVFKLPLKEFQKYFSDLAYSG